MHNGFVILLAVLGIGFTDARRYYDKCNGMYCFANACTTTKCPQQRGAKCRTTCNGCIAHFYDKFGNEVTDKCQCPWWRKAMPCEDDPCDTAKCNLPSSRAECRTNTCGGCEAVFYDRRAREIRQCPIKDPCSKVCKTDACDVETCPRQVGASCRSSCNGCNANFFDRFGNDVTEDCKCKRGSPVLCFVNPCDFATCPGRPDAVCRYNSCDGCTAVFYDKSGRKVKCKKPGSGAGPTCPPLPPGTVGICVERCSGDDSCPGDQKCCSNGSGHVCKEPYYPECPGGKPLACKPPACAISTCPRQTGAVCKPTCFGCIPHFFDKFGNEVTEDCQCRGRVPEHDCKDICKGLKCRNHPDAECRVDRCGGCEAVFYDRSGKRVKCKSEPETDPKCPATTSSLPMPVCRHLCYSNRDCGRKICCSTGCGSICVDPPKYDRRCPLSVAPVSSLACGRYMCGSNSDCRSDYMCCENYCGSTCQPKPKTCEPGEFLAKCRNVCEDAECPRHKGATCRVHGCGGCKHEFYDKHNLIIKDCFVVPRPIG